MLQKLSSLSMTLCKNERRYTYVQRGGKSIQKI